MKLQKKAKYQLGGVAFLLFGVILVIPGGLSLSPIANCTFQGVLNSAPAYTSYGVGQQIVFNGRIYVGPGTCNYQQYAGFIINYWSITSGFTATGVATVNNQGYFNFTITAPSGFSTITIITSYCTQSTNPNCTTPATKYITTSLNIVSSVTTYSQQFNLVDSVTNNALGAGYYVTVNVNLGAQVCAGYTNAQGQFTCAGLQSGSYQATIVDPNLIYSPATPSFSIGTSQPSPLVVPMSKGVSGGSNLPLNIIAGIISFAIGAALIYRSRKL